MKSALNWRPYLMKQFNVCLTETFLGDMLDIMLYILEKSGVENPKKL
jgi:hypothetical protein